MKKRVFALSLALILLLTSCNKPHNNGGENGGGGNGGVGGGASGKDESSYGEDLGDLGAYDGFFEEETTASDIVITRISGTQGCYTLTDGTLTFSGISQDTVYAISGKLNGNIVIDVDDAYKFDLEMHGFSLVSSETNPVTVLGGNEVSLKAKKNTENYIYDTRSAVDESDTTIHPGAIYSEVDLEMSGKGELTVISENNKGIHSKKDLQVKNLTITVSCADNALKGNDSVSLENTEATLIATVGDCVKTSNSDISSKGSQRGIVSITDSVCDIYAACDGIDAAYDVIVEGAETSLNIYTDKYSNYSEDVTKVDTTLYYIRFNYNDYSYSVKYYNSDSDYLWVNAEYHSERTVGNTTYYYYSFPRRDDYSGMQFFMYTSDMEQGQDENYAVKSDYMSPNEGADTFALISQWNNLYYEWTEYSATPSSSMGGPGGRPGGMGGGMNEGNADKGDHSTKGIKSGTSIQITSGSVNVKSYDDAIHAGTSTPLENGKTPSGNVTLNGGAITLYSNDDGVHADGALVISGGSVSVLNSYEGIEGSTVTVSGGALSVVAKDDGINSTASTGTAVTLSGGKVYIYCSGDGIDTNTQTSGEGILFSGADVVVISTSGGNSAIDTERGYSYTGGSVVAVMQGGGMSREATNCSNFSSVGTTDNLSLKKGNYLTASIGSTTVTVRMPVSISAFIVLLGSNSAEASTSSSSSVDLDEGQVTWN